MKKEKKYIFFGYGSLLNRVSLSKTIPNIENIRTGTLLGFRRVFNLRAKRMISKCGPIAVLDIIEDKQSFVNGVYFELSEKGLEKMKEREILYDFIEVDIITKNNSHINALTVQAKGRARTDYKFDCDLQKKYLDICLLGAKSRGRDFYKDFLRTSFIDKKNIFSLSEKVGF